MTLGYLEAKRLLFGLEGRRYFIDAPYEETYYLERLMSEMELFRIVMKTDGEEKPKPEGWRFYTEVLFPRTAKELKLKPDWNYKDLYVAILEKMARQMQIFRYRVYTADELLNEIRKAAGRKIRWREERKEESKDT